MISIIAVYALLAITFPLAKLLVLLMPAVYAIGVRMCIAGTILLALGALYKQIWFKRDHILLLLGTSLIHIAIPYLTEFIALESISGTDACLAYNLSPLCAALFSYLFFKEKMTRTKWIGLSVALSSMGWYIYSEHIHAIIHSAWPYVLMLSSVISSSLGWILVRMLVRKGYSPIFINGFCMLFSGIFSFLWGLYLQPIHMIIPVFTQIQFWTVLACLLIIANGIFYNMYGYLLKRYTATLLSFIGCITPLFSAFFEWILLGVVPSYLFFIALVGMSLGIYLFYQEELRQGYIA